MEEKTEREIVEVVEVVKKSEHLTLWKDREKAFDHSKFAISGLLLNLQRTGNRFGVDFHNILMLLYLDELGSFPYKLEIMGHKTSLIYFASYNFIQEDFAYNGGRYWKVTKYGKEIVDFFYSTINKNDSFIKDNRAEQLDAEGSVKVALDGYFD
jgi:hypothetical protein